MSSNHNKSKQKEALSPYAIIATVMAIIGLFFFGMVIGPVAIALAAMAISQIRDQGRLRGKALAIFALCLGIVDIIVWVALIGFLLRPGLAPLNTLPLIESGPAGPSIEGAPAPIRQAMRDNVIVEVRDRDALGLARETVARGSGIIVGQNRSGSLILTSRHLVAKGEVSDSGVALNKTRDIRLVFMDNTYSHARVVWTPRQEIDLALVSDSPTYHEIPLEKDKTSDSFKPGDKVFAVGNPLGLDWTYTEGVISAIRKATVREESIDLIQTQAPVNTGNSGGGLYLVDGTLIGVITWARPKQISEGIGLAISYGDFLRLYTEDPNWADPYLPAQDK
jgi:S1-C subfamily serine protease